ncbi:MAG: AGE family epimerase/isomerase [Pseudomonadota bacterium]
MSVLVHPIILCGGSGSRLWPLSRQDFPKQFVSVNGQTSLFGQALERTRENPSESLSYAEPTIVGSAAFEEHIRAQVDEAGGRVRQIILEPFGMDSAPALAVAVASLLEKSPSDIALLLTSDHQIAPLRAFQNCVRQAVNAIEAHGWVMTFGIVPTHAETQFGYVEYMTDDMGASYHPVSCFHEKPDQSTAEDYLRQGNFMWNSGMFAFRISHMAELLATYAPKTWQYAQAACSNGVEGAGTLLLASEDFAQCDRKSIDYAIMEPLSSQDKVGLGLVPSAFQWRDLGSWGQVYEAALKHDRNGNVVSGNAVVEDVANSYITSSGRLVAVSGLENVVVVQEPDCTLVTSRTRAGSVKTIYSKLGELERPELASPAAFDAPAEFSEWLYSDAYPLWAKAGVGADVGVFEHLDLKGSPVFPEHLRFRVVPRQIYCFSKWLLKLKRDDSEDLLISELETSLRTLLDYMISTGWRSQGGWVHRFDAARKVSDDRADTYDHCFVLLALASLHEATLWPEARQWADRTLAYMDDALADVASGGYFEDDLRSVPRRANPHMHFLEAMLAWHTVTGEQQFLDRADVIVDMFYRHFFDPQTGTVREFFDESWAVVLEGKGALAEPGHHYEWGWLLLMFDKLRPDPKHFRHALSLYTFARAYGHNLTTGAVLDFVPADAGTGDDAPAAANSCRCWPVTEAIKITGELDRRGITGAGAFRNEMCNVLLSRYLGGPANMQRSGSRPARGSWIDAINELGRPLHTKAPASTFYHIVCAVENL